MTSEITANLPAAPWTVNGGATALRRRPLPRPQRAWTSAHVSEPFRGRSTFIAFVVTIALLLLAAPSGAQVSRQALAESLFDEGRALMGQEKYAEACPKFRASLDIEEKSGTLLNLAECHKQLGWTASAWAEFKLLEARSKQEGRANRADYAREQAQALFANLSRVKIDIARAHEGLVVAVDGQTIAAATLDTAFPIDPGEHAITASAPGRKTHTAKVEVPAGPAEVTVAIPTLEPDVKPTPASAPTPAPRPQPATPSEAGGVSPLVFVGFGVAGAGAIVGAITGGLTLANASELDASCGGDDICFGDDLDKLATTKTLAHVSTAAFAIAGAGALVGVIGLLLPTGDDGDVAVSMGVGRAALHVRF